MMTPRIAAKPGAARRTMATQPGPPLGHTRGGGPPCLSGHRVAGSRCAPPPYHSLLGLRHDPHVRLRRLPASWELLLGLSIGDRPADDHGVTLLPVDGGRDLVLRRQLAGV